jgi:putative ABC transport system permease protein
VPHVRLAVRMLQQEKSFTALVVFTLALGIGSTAAVFGMADQLLLRPLPGVHDGRHVAYLRFDTPAGVEKSITTPEFDEVRRNATVLDGIASYDRETFDASAGGIHGVRADVAFVYGDYFEMLGVGSAAGRLLRASDTGFEADPLEAVLSERMATAIFGSASAAVGRMMYLNNLRFMVVGVAGAGFAGSERDASIDVWLPLGADAPLFGESIERLRGPGGAPHGQFIVRPRKGVRLKAVASQLGEILRPLARAEPAFDSDARLAAAAPILAPGLGLSPEVRPRVMSAIRLLSVVVALVLLIACANVANLLLFRNVAKRGAMTTRMALGASVGRIAREYFVQSLFLGVLGAVVGVGAGWLLSLLFRGWALGNAPAFQGLLLDGRLALFAALASIGTALLFGTVPAALAGRFDLASALRQTDVRHSHRMAVFRSALSAGQLALTLTLGVGALLLVRTVHRLNTADTGLNFHGVASLVQSHKVNMTRAETDVLARRVLAAVGAVPGVQDVALGPPDLDAPYGGKTAVGLPGAANERRVDARIVPTTPGWFGIFRVAPARGRLFREDDWHEDAPYNAVLTASLARKLFGTEDNAVDRTLGGIFNRPELHVIGIVPNLSGNQAPDVPKDIVFVTYAFPPVTSSEFSFVVRSGNFDSRVAEGIRSALSASLPDQPVEDPEVLSAERAHIEQEMLSQLLVLLSALAATLAAVGLYGVIAFIVAGRRRELAIRIALGAAPWPIVRLVFRHAAMIVVIGTLFGLGGAYALSRTLQNRLFEVGPFDPASYLTAAVLLGFVAAVASLIPARRAVRLDPVSTLREE